MNGHAGVLLAVGWLLVAVMMTALWLVQRRRRDAGVVDVGWAAGLGLLAVLYGIWGGGDWRYRLLVVALGGAVVVPPGDLHLCESGARQGRGRPLPDAARQMGRRRPGSVLRAYCGVVLWLTAVVGESTADRELAAYRADPSHRGTTCRTGLWRYSRHPNYFFEWLHWWTYVVIAAGAPWWWVTLVSPALMTFFLFKVTGIPATEAQALATRGDDYREYQRTTSVFVPWFPKR
jgi:steroid 5-alpha reductase family enzyme